MTVQTNPLADPSAVVAEVGSTAEAALVWLRANGTEWGIAIAAIIGVFLVLRLLRATVAGIIGSSRKPASAVRNIVASVVSATKSAFLLLIATTVTLPFFVQLTEQHAGWLRTAAMVITILQIAFWVRVVARAFITRLGDDDTAQESTLVNAMGLIMVFVNVIIFAVALIMIADNLSFDVTGLVAGLGVGGIAIGLAAQSLFEDLFAGLSIILDKPFVKGDFINFGDKNGVVEKVGLKSTRIRTLTGQQLAINNSNILSHEINNFRRMAERRISTRIGVTYDTPHAKLERLPGQIRQIVEGTEGLRFDRCHLAAYGDFSILFELVFHVLSKEFGDYMDRQQRVFLEIHSLFEREGIDFAFPTQTVHLGSMPEGQRAQGSMAAQ